MATPSSRLTRITAVAAGCLGLAVAAGVVAPAFGSATPHRGTARHAAHQRAARARPVVRGSRYLALGDSVPFGYREANSIPAPNFQRQRSFIGFPEVVAAKLGLKLANAACPGETTASFMKTTAQSNGCENSYPKAKNPLGYRSVYPLHVKYRSAHESQLTLAERSLTKHPGTRLVTLMIGANDGFLCAKTTKDGCFSEFGALQAKITRNVTKILKGIRNTAHYQGQIALVTYYSLNYSNATDNLESQGLNSALKKAAKPFHAEIANGYGQFRRAARKAHGDACAAHLLTALSGKDKGTCGVHPSLAGAKVLARAVERAIKK
jgi:lysophospholipase L1-like esterase